MATSVQPPTLDDEDNYAKWRYDIEMWSLCTNLANNKTGPAIFLALPPSIRDCVRSIPKADVAKEGGLDLILQALDKIYLADANTRAYLCFKEFYSFKRASGVSVPQFLVQFEYLYSKLEQFEIKLPEGVKAFFILNALNVSEDDEKIARTTCGELNYNNMKDAIKRLFGDVNSGNSVTPAVKSEPESVNFTNRYRSRGRGNFRGRSNYRGGRNSFQSYRRENPKDSEGRTWRCFKCNSTRHLARECPMKDVNVTESEYSNEKERVINISLLNIDTTSKEYDALKVTESKQKVSLLLQETLGMAVLDTACSSTIAGKIWFNSFCEMMTDKERKQIQSWKSEKVFVFGDGMPVKAERTVKFPVCINSRINAFITADIVESNLPLLLSHESMRTANIIIDCKRARCEILGENVKLKLTTSGHYALPLSNTLLDGPNKIVLHSVALDKCSKSQKLKKAMKLHRQFAHASREKLIELIKKSKFNDEEFLAAIDEVCRTCEICQKFKRPPLRPVVSMPLGKHFNDTVTLDLKEHVHNESWVLHLIDCFSRYSAARIIKSKKQEVIIKNIYMMWISYFGPPNRFMSDNGGEFNNSAYRSMNEQLNVITCTTPAESPFSNGIVERHNLVVYENMKKVMDEAKCDAETALAWAISAKNALSNKSGYSPNELIFGFNPNSGSVLTDKLPALYPNTENEIVRMNMNARYSAKVGHIEAENSEKIRKALRSKVRSYAEEEYVSGQKVYYKRQNTKGWRGPAVVLGSEGKFVLIRHGGAFHRMHPCQLMKVDRNVEGQAKPLENIIQKELKATKNEERKERSSEKNIIEDEESENERELGENSEEVDAEEVDEHMTEHNDELEIPSRKSQIEYKLNGEWKNGKVMNMQPKRNSKYKNWVNIEGDGEDLCVNFEHVEEWREIPLDNGNDLNEEYVVYLNTQQENLNEVQEAKKKELENMRINNVYEVVPFKGQKTVSTKWIITEKIKEGERKVKARIVAKGFEENNYHLRTDSPTCSRESMRLVVMTTVMMNWKLQTIDFTSAFLQGDEIGRELYLRMPDDVCSQDEVWKLKRCIYGLNDAPRAWYDKVKKVLKDFGGKPSMYDNALYFWHDKDMNLLGILAIHVDDFMYGGSMGFESTVIEKIKKTLRVGSHESGSFKYLGLNVKQHSNEIKIDQKEYVEKIEEIEISKSRSSRKNDELSTEEKTSLKKLAGKLLWVSTNTRPDIAFDVCKVSNPGKSPKVNAIIEANNTVRKLKLSTGCITFPSIGKVKDMQVLVYSDATYASLEDGASQGAYIIFVKGKGDKMAPISWSSKRLDRVTKSPIASETLALSEGADAGVLIAAMLQETFKLPKLPNVNCKTDNASLVETLSSDNLVKDKRLRIDIARIKEMIQNEEICVEWVKGNEQISDCLTKSGASSASLRECMHQ